MDRIERALGAVTKYFDYVSRIAIFALMALVTINVILRYVWTSISGTYDYVQLITAVAIGAAIAYTAYERGNIEIEMLMDRFPKRVQAIMASVMSFIALLFFVMATWRLVVLGRDMQAAGETTMTAYVPFAPFLYFIAVGFALMILALIAQFMRHVRRAINPERVWPEAVDSKEVPPEVLKP